jgi:7-carboxy-7-deazaguanine synthase
MGKTQVSAIRPKIPSWPVIEMFGPTVQGEGVDQGVACHFVRFGGCDYRCDWCDTPYAVLPNQVRANSTKMSTADILLDLDSRPHVPWVVLSGGNPALHDLTHLVQTLHDHDYLVAVETQGSRWREWMKGVDRLCVSPKPPSSNEPKSKMSQLARFLQEGMAARESGMRPYEWLFLKVVCFTPSDLDYAVNIRKQLSDAMMFLSAGNDAGATVAYPGREDLRSLAGIRMGLLDQARWLTEEVLKRPELCAQDVYIQAQFHTLLWGNGRGF